MNASDIYCKGFSRELLRQCFGADSASDVAIETPCLGTADCLLGTQSLYLSPLNRAQQGPQFSVAREAAPSRHDPFRLGHTAWQAYEYYERGKDAANLTLGALNFGYKGTYQLTQKGNYSFSGSGSKRLMWKRSWYRPGHKLLAKLAIGETFLKRLKWVQMIAVPIVYGVDVGLAELDGDEVEKELARKAFAKEVPKAVIGGLVTAGLVMLATAISSAVVMPLLVGLASGIVIGMAFDWAWDRWVDPDAKAIEQLSGAVLGAEQSVLMVP